MYQGVIYCAISPSGKKYYGFTYNLHRRKYIHKRDSIVKKNCFYNAIKKYGFDNFVWNIIETYINEDRKYIKDVLRKREKYWIEKDKTFLPEFGYNMTHGGDGGDTFSNQSDEDKNKIKSKIGKSSTGRKNPLCGQSIYNYWIKKYGKEIADEKLIITKKNRSDSHKGKSHPCSEQTKEKIRKKLTNIKISEENRKKRLGNKNASGKRNDEARLNISKSHIGLPSPNKGKHASKETKDKISKAKSGENHHYFDKHFTEEHKRNLSNSHKERIRLKKQESELINN
jgi:group I intron endonuclease